MQKYLETGKIINVHGVAGMVKVECWSDSVEAVTSLPYIYFSPEGDGKRKVEKATYLKQFALLKLEGIDDRDAAASLRGRVIYADREDIELEEGDHFITDLIGLKVIDADNGEIYGEISDVLVQGAQDLYVVTHSDGATSLLPAIKPFVIEIDFESGVKVRPIPGMFDDGAIKA
ncbi:MAG: 16S rRNA processing protein RimM [Clostridiales bacterium]|nr:16S rRNA processing protein RimM [Clostridiales bacterium]